jgi:hypothetical protein
MQKLQNIAGFIVKNNQKQVRQSTDDLVSAKNLTLSKSFPKQV